MSSLANAMVAALVVTGCGRGGESTPVSNTSVEPAMPPADDEREWSLLHAVYGAPDSLEALGPLASFYEQRGAWDEMSAVRSRMLILTPPRTTPGFLPGGPFPRIGVPRTTPRPHTVLGRWINARALPELYGSPEIGPHELVIRLRAEKPDTADAFVRFGDALVADLQLVSAEVHYTRAVQLDASHARARGRLADMRRIREASAAP